MAYDARTGTWGTQRGEDDDAVWMTKKKLRIGRKRTDSFSVIVLFYMCFFLLGFVGASKASILR